jgi:hypothetical protein
MPIIFGISIKNWSAFLLLALSVGFPTLNNALLAVLSLQFAASLETSNSSIMYALSFATFSNALIVLFSVILIKRFTFRVLYIAHTLSIISVVFLWLAIDYKHEASLYIYAILMGAGYTISYSAKSTLVELQMRNLGGGTVGHGVKVVFDNCFYGLSYFVHSSVFSGFDSEENGPDYA